MFILPTAVTISGTEYPVRTDFRVILEIFVMLGGAELSDLPGHKNSKKSPEQRVFFEKDDQKLFTCGWPGGPDERD